jgi:hypothetical protein
VAVRRASAAPAQTTLVVPDLRLRFMVRDPSPACGLHSLHEVAGLCGRRPVKQALRENRIYLKLNRYDTQLEGWLDHFPRRQSRVAPEVRIPSGRAAEPRTARADQP